MKLVIVTLVDEYKKEILKLFKEADVFDFSGLDIEGFKSTSAKEISTNWFASESYGSDSEMYFSFTDESKIDALFEAIRTFNKSLKSNNLVRAVVLPIEKYI
jgi:hypothetical protein